MNISKIPDLQIRQAERKDAALIVKYIRDLASYENELDQVTVTAADLETNMFGQNGAQVREQNCGRLEWWCHD